MRGGAPLNPPFSVLFVFCVGLGVGGGPFMIFCPQTSHTLQLLTRNQKQWTNESVTLTVSLESLDCRTPKKKFQRPLTAALTAA